MSLSSINFPELLKHPEVSAAYNKAGDVVNWWLKRLTPDERECVERTLVGWPGFDLLSRIAEAVLDAKGFDLDELDVALWDKQPASDTLGEFDAWRKEQAP